MTLTTEQHEKATEFAEALVEKFKKELNWGGRFGLDNRGVRIESYPNRVVVYLDRLQPSPQPTLYKVRKWVKEVTEADPTLNPLHVSVNPFNGHVVVQLGAVEGPKPYW